MNTSDWVLAISTVVLAATALTAPVLTEWLKRRFWAPRLRLSFFPGKPDCHRTDYFVGGVPGVEVPAKAVHVYRLRVTNVGRSQARRCEVVLEGMARENAGGEMIWYDRFTPVQMVWGSGAKGDTIDINKDRTVYCDLVYVLHPEHQDFFKNHGGFREWPETSRDGLGVEIRITMPFASMPNWLSRGKYMLRFAVFSDNAAVARMSLTLGWSGTWVDSEAAMLQECVIRSL